MLGLGFALTNFGTKGGVVDTPDLSGSSAAALLAAYGGEGFSMIFDSTAPSIKITDSTTPSNDWDSDLGDGYSVQDFFKSRSFTSYSGPVSTGKRLMQADGYIKPCRHNLLPMSNRFGSGAWTRTDVTSTYGQTDVDGGATASLITESNTSTSVLYNATAFTTAANVPYTISCKIKKGNSTWVRLAFGTSGGTFTNGVQQWYNLDTVATGTAATTGTASYISSSITATTNSYYILTLTASQASTTGAFIVSTATADASATRTTSGTYYICHAMCNSGSSVLDYVSSEAHNLVIQSRTLGTSWTATDITVGNDATTSPDGTTSAESLTEGVAGTALLRSTAFTVPASSTVTASFYFKTSTATWVRFTLADGSDTNGVRQWFNLSTGAKGTLTAIGSGTATSSAITACANGWYLCEITGVCSTSTSLTMSVSSASADASNTRVNSVVYYADCAQAELATSAGKVTTTTTTSVFNPHFDLPIEYNTNGTVKALTREEARTNLCLRNTALATSPWATTLITPTNNSATAPDGTTTATLLTTLSTSGDCYQSITITAAAYTWSVYVKQTASNPSTYVYINAYDGSDHRSWFNLSTGAVGTNDTGNTSTITAITNSWYRITVTRTAGGTGGYFVLGLSDADNSLAVTSGNQVYAWGAQLEAGSTASSPIVTGSAAVTRAADTVYFQSTVYPHSATEDHFFYAKHGYDIGTTAGVSRVIGLDSSTKTPIAKESNVRDISYDSTNQLTPSNGASITNGTGVFRKSAYTSSGGSSGESAFTMDGQAAVTQGASGMSFSQRIELGSYAGLEQLNGGLIEFMYVPSRLTNGQLQTITTA